MKTLLPRLLLATTAAILLSSCQTSKVTLPNGVAYESRQFLLWAKRGPITFTQTSATTSTLTIGASEVNQTSVVKQALIEAANKLTP